MDLMQMGYGYGQMDTRSFNFTLYVVFGVKVWNKRLLQVAFAQSTFLVANTGTGGPESLIRSG